MAECKCVINDVKQGKSYQKEIVNDDFVGKKIGDKLSGSSFGLIGYELQITGGSDNAGLPMRPDLSMIGRRKMLVRKGDVGSRIKEKGKILRKTVVGNTIDERTAQINFKIIKYGAKNVQELLGGEKKEEGKTETKPAQQPKQEASKTEDTSKEKKK